MASEYDQPATSLGDQWRLPARDALMDELRDRLENLTKTVIGDPTLTEEFPVVRLEKSTARDHILQRADSLLTETNAAISGLRTARASVERHDNSAVIIPGAHDTKSPVGVAVLSLGMAVPIVTPAILWITWPYDVKAIGGFLAFLAAGAMIGIGIGVAVIAFWSAKRALDRDASFGRLGGMIALTLTTIVGAGLIVWQISNLIWPLVLLTAILAGILILILLTRVSEQLSQPGTSQICRGLLTRAWLLLFMAILYGIAAGLISSRVVGSSARGAVGVACLIILLTPALLPLLVNAYDRLRGRSPHEVARLVSERQVLVDSEKKAMQAWEEAIKAAIRDRLKNWAGDIEQPPFSLYLNIASSHGLRHMRAQDCVVATKDIFTRFEEIIAPLGSGAIGVAGPRGVGKSTLLEAYRDGRFIGAGREHLVLFESVPVRYDPRDFALHLYAAFCQKTIEFSEQHAGREPGVWWQRLLRLSRFVPALPTLLTWLAVGSLVTALLYGDSPGNRIPLVTLVWLLGVALAAGVIMSILAGKNYLAQSSATLMVTDLPTLCNFARAKLDVIHFQQRHTTGWSGSLTPSFGFNVGRSGTLEKTRQAMSYPELVADFRSFLIAAVRVIGAFETAAKPAPVAIIIDELDKVQSPEQAQEFVNELKALFGVDVPGCIFLVSVSDEALASFERRGLPMRDAFDNAFDFIFRVGYLHLQDTRSVLRSRVAGLGEPFVCLCHCFSGGLPREIIRVARSIAALERKTLGQVCRVLVAQSITDQIASLHYAIQANCDIEPFSSELVRHIEEYGRADAGALLAALYDPPVKNSDCEADDRLRGLAQVQLVEFSFLYYCATLLQIFDDEMDQQKLRSGYAINEPACFERLAIARRRLSVNARLAWLTVHSFRRAWRLSENDPSCPWPGILSALYREPESWTRSTAGSV